MSRVRRLSATGLVMVAVALVAGRRRLRFVGAVVGIVARRRRDSDSIDLAAAATAEPTTPVAPASTAAGAARIADLAYLVDELKAIHPNPFLDEGEAAFIDPRPSHRGSRRHPDRHRLPGGGDGADGSSRTRRPLRRLGHGPTRRASARLADLAVGLPGRPSGRGRPRSGWRPHRRPADPGRRRDRRGRQRRPSIRSCHGTTSPTCAPTCRCT